MLKGRHSFHERELTWLLHCKFASQHRGRLMPIVRHSCFQMLAQVLNLTKDVPRGGITCKKSLRPKPKSSNHTNHPHTRAQKMHAPGPKNLAFVSRCSNRTLGFSHHVALGMNRSRSLTPASSIYRTKVLLPTSSHWQSLSIPPLQQLTHRADDVPAGSLKISSGPPPSGHLTNHFRTLLLVEPPVDSTATPDRS